MGPHPRGDSGFCECRSLSAARVVWGERRSREGRALSPAPAVARGGRRHVVGVSLLLARQEINQAGGMAGSRAQGG